MQLTVRLLGVLCLGAAAALATTADPVLAAAAAAADPAAAIEATRDVAGAAAGATASPASSETSSGSEEDAPIADDTDDRAAPVADAEVAGGADRVAATLDTANSKLSPAPQASQQQQQQQPAAPVQEVLHSKHHSRHHGRYKRYEDLTLEERKRRRHASNLFFLLLVALIGAQVGIFYWKKTHIQSFQYVTLAGLWIFPTYVSVRLHFWQFLFCLAIFTTVTGYYVHMASRVPLDATAPRRVYRWFIRVYKACYVLGIFGYGLLMFDISGFRLLFGLPAYVAAWSLRSLFYGLYFGVLGRDVAEICSWRMNQSMGYTKKDDDEPQRVLPDNICALCGLELNPDLEHLVEGQDYSLAEQYRRAGAATLALRYDFAAQRYAGAHGNRVGTDDPDAGLAAAMRPERIVRLKCGHEFHEFCVRGWAIVGKQSVCPNCGERVDIRSVLGSTPWENQNLIWAQLLDALRYLIVWNPIIIIFVQLSAYEFGI